MPASKLFRYVYYLNIIFSLLIVIVSTFLRLRDKKTSKNNSLQESKNTFYVFKKHVL